MKNLAAIIVIIVGVAITIACAVHLVPSLEPASTLQWWTYGLFGGLIIAAVGVYGLKKQSDND